MKERLDKLLVERGFLNSREKARAYILGGRVKIEGEVVYKASFKVPINSDIQIKVPNKGYVSRGGVKLEEALKYFAIDVKGALCLDIGSSTGGFTDCLLQRGAKKVIAVDVGKNQLDYRLRIDNRVEVVEGFNARYIDKLELEGSPDIVTIDVSFISITRILEPLASILHPFSRVVVLIKPQFELEKNRPGFKGVVRENTLHVEVLQKLNAFFVKTGYLVIDYTFSPLKGPRGNIEYFVYLKPGNVKGAPVKFKPEQKLQMLVEKAHAYFKKKQPQDTIYRRVK